MTASISQDPTQTARRERLKLAHKLMRLPINRRYWIGFKDPESGGFYAEPQEGLTITELLAEVAKSAEEIDSTGESICFGVDHWTPRVLLDEDLADEVLG